MKNIVRILSVLVAAGAVVILLSSVTDMGNSFNEIADKVLGLMTMNILPLISIALCSYCLERNDTNYLTRIIPFYMSIPIFLSIFITFIDLGSNVVEIISNIISFMSTTYLCLTVLSLLLIIKSNNQITRIIKFIAYAAIVVNVVLAVYIQIKIYMVDTLPNVYEYDRYGGFGFATVGETEELSSKVYSASVIIEGFSILLLFMTNYAFSSKLVIDADELDYDKLKEDAIKMSKASLEARYNNNKDDVNIENNVPQEKGLMNISNQLGKDSIVGKVDKAAKEVNIVGASVEDFMPLSHGPVINNSVAQNTSQNQSLPVSQAPINNQQINQTQPTSNNQPVNNGSANPSTQPPSQNKFLV